MSGAGCGSPPGLGLFQRRRWGYIKEPFEKETPVMLKWNIWVLRFGRHGPPSSPPAFFCKLLGYETVSNEHRKTQQGKM